MKQLSLFDQMQDDKPPFFFKRGICYTFDTRESMIDKVPFEWGKESYPVGTRFERLGETGSRTGLNIGYDLIYQGKRGGFVLFSVDDNWQHDPYFIAIAYLSSDELFMFSNYHTGWDIRL